MRAWLIRVLTRLLVWLDPPPIVPPDLLLDAARLVVATTAEIQRVTPQHTRLVRLLSAEKLLQPIFPDRPIRDLHFAIERVLQESA